MATDFAETPHVPEPLPNQDPRLERLKLLLASAPEKRTELSKLTSHSLIEARSATIALRSEDIVTFFLYFADGKIPVSSFPDSKTAIMAKTRGWFYLSPIEDHPFFAAHPEFVDPKTRISFETAVRDSKVIYAGKMAFATAFSQSVFPLLKDNWRLEANKFLADYDPVFGMSSFRPEKHPDEINESFISLMEPEIEAIAKSSTPEKQLRLRPRRFPVLGQLRNYLARQEMFDPIIKHLQTVHQTRGGITVGFNENVLQGKVFSYANEPSENRIVHGQELVVKPESGFIDLSVNPVTAIESLGEYEDDVLQILLPDAQT